MTARARLHHRRSAETFSFNVGGLQFTCTVGRFPDGRVGEIFIDSHKGGSSADVAARDAAIACSIGLQYGADLETIRKALCRDAQGRALGPLAAAIDLIVEVEP